MASTVYRVRRLLSPVLDWGALETRHGTMVPLNPALLTPAISPVVGTQHSTVCGHVQPSCQQRLDIQTLCPRHRDYLASQFEIFKDLENASQQLQLHVSLPWNDKGASATLIVLHKRCCCSPQCFLRRPPCKIGLALTVSRLEAMAPERGISCWVAAKECN